MAAVPSSGPQGSNLDTSPPETLHRRLALDVMFVLAALAVGAVLLYLLPQRIDALPLGDPAKSLLHLLFLALAATAAYILAYRHPRTWLATGLLVGSPYVVLMYQALMAIQSNLWPLGLGIAVVLAAVPLLTAYLGFGFRRLRETVPRRMRSAA